jgi:Flp pilus assembly protein TadD
MTPKSANSKLAYARTCMAKGNHWEAFPIFQLLLKNFPHHPAIWYEYGKAAALVLKLDVAEQAWQKACESAPNDPELFLQIGRHYTELRQRDKACAHLKRASALNPKSSDPLISLAIIYEHYNFLNEARETVQQCLALDPRDESALYLQAILTKRDGKIEDAEKQLSDLISADPQHPYVRSACRFELAQLCDKRGEVDKAFEYLKEAKELIRGTIDAPAIENAFDANGAANLNFVKNAPKDILAGWLKGRRQDPATARRLALLGGHPRSGTTLLEQVVSGHPEVAGLDEPIAFTKGLLPFIHKSGKLNGAQQNYLRNTYVQGLEMEAGPEMKGRMLLDKNPALTAQLPLLLQLFPEMKVIIALRDPRDVIVSCYFLNVTLAAGNVKFLSLEGVAQHYALLMGIWLHVREWEELSWIESRYEDVIENVPKEGRRVMSDRPPSTKAQKPGSLIRQTTKK